MRFQVGPREFLRFLRSLRARTAQDPGERAFCAQAVVKKAMDLDDTAAVGAGLGVGLAMLVEPLAARPEALWILEPAHVGFFLTLLAQRKLVTRASPAWHVLGFLLHLFALGAYFVTVYLAVQRGEANVPRVLVGWTLASNLGIFSILAAPLPGAAWVLAAVYFALSAAIWAPVFGGAKVVLAAGTIFALATVFKRVMSRYAWHEASEEYRGRALLVRVEKGRVEQDFLLAQRVQAALGVPPAQRCGPFVARFSLRQHAEVGGDWIAARRMDDDTAALLVVDAAGKGVQAALVIHAIQALWVEAEERAAFDPRAWLLSVNRTLVKMGARETHGATLGLLTVSAAGLAYWSAGHVPLYVVRREGDGVVAKPLGRAGGMAGLDLEQDLEPTLLPAAELGGVEAVLLASDGIFPKGYSHKTEEVLHVLREVALKGDAALAGLGAEDDKSLVVLERHHDV